MSCQCMVGRINAMRQSWQESGPIRQGPCDQGLTVPGHLPQNRLVLDARQIKLLWRIVQMSGSVWDIARKREKKLRSMKNGNLFFYLLTLTQFGPAVIYLSLISVVLARPEVLTSLGLQPFVDYVTYELQFDGYKNLVTQQLWGPDFEVYYYQMNAAAILIVGILAIVIYIWVTILAMLFSDLLYYQLIFNRMRKYQFTQYVYIALIICLPYILFYSPETVHSGSRRSSTLLYRNAGGWAGFVLIWSFFAPIVCMHIMTVKRHIFGRRTGKSSS